MRGTKTCAALLALGLVTAGAACNGTTGDQLVTFQAYAAGAAGAATPFTVGGYVVQLSQARMRIGAVYVDQAPIATGAEGPSCIDPGVYTAQVPGGVEVDLLSSARQEFSVIGNGTADIGLTWEMWLTDGDINEVNTAHMVDLQGTATRVSDGAMFTFGAVVTINNNRLIPTSDPSQPGLNPICKQRIIQIGGIDLPFFQGGTMLVTVDPRQWFNLDIDFSTLPLATSDTCLLDPDADYGTAQFCIPDTNFASGPGAAQGQQLFSGILTGGSAAYSIAYAKSP